MPIYISTGNYSKLPADKTSEKLIASGIDAIELSGGSYSSNTIENLCKLKKKASFQIHNYFPPPKIPFVFNLASQDKEVLKLSLNHAYHAIDCCLKLGAKYFSFHAGFLCDLQVNELGKKIKRRKLYNRKKSVDIFLEKISLISKKAENNGIKIMVENNVFSQINKKEFLDNPLLMCDAKECLQIMNQVPKNVKLLIDVAHLKVSSNSLGFNPVTMINECSYYAGGYHLSDNNGFSDTNDSFLENAWFLKYLRTDLEYYSIEVYGKPINEIIKLKDIVKQKLSKSNPTNN